MQAEVYVKGKGKGKGKGKEWTVLLQSVVACPQVDGEPEISVAGGEATVEISTGQYDVEIRAQLSLHPLTETLRVSFEEADEPEAEAAADPPPAAPPPAAIN